MRLRHLAIPLTALAFTLACAGAASAHDGNDRASMEQKRAEYTSGFSLPVVNTPNVRWVSADPDTAAISGCFAKTAPYFYVSSLDSISVYDTSDPVHPRLAGRLDNLVFENEAMNCGERKNAEGTVERFVLVGIDAVQASPGDITHVGTFDEFLVVDVTDQTAPYIRSRAATTSSTHTVSCVRDTACDYVYTAGAGGHFSILDLTDLDAPREVATSGSPALDYNPQFGGGAGHKWDFDDAGFGTHTGSGGSAIFDVTDPVHPKLVASTGQHGVALEWNDFIHHNSFRPNAAAFRPDAAPSMANGNILLVTEEDYEQPDCSKAGSFQTWHVKRLDGTPGSIVPLDKVELSDLGTFPIPVGTFCSAHWFDYNPAGIVAVGYYGGGLQLLDVRNPLDIKSYGAAVWGASEVWSAYWVPVYNKNGTATGKRTNIVYAVDLVRGLDVYTVDLPGSPASTDLLPGPLGLTAVIGSGGLSISAIALALFVSLLVRRRVALHPIPRPGVTAAAAAR